MTFGVVLACMRFMRSTAACIGLAIVFVLIARAGATEKQPPGATTRVEAPRVVIAIGEDEYHANETLPAFAKSELEGKFHFKVTVLQSDDKTNLPGLSALKDADLLIIFMRRRSLPADQLAQFQAYFNSGRPVVALRTSCHAFQNWLEFDRIVLGCNYNNHYAAKGKLEISVAPGGAAASDPILRGVIPSGFQSDSSLYKVLPLAPSCAPLLIGNWEDKPAEPVAWTNHYKGGRIFFTSLGSPDDFKLPQFRRLLSNGVLWALGRSIPEK
jgi:type 1 glutamine amidotransferase